MAQTKNEDRISKNVDLAKRFYVAFDSGDPSQMNRLIADRAVDHDGEGATALESMRGLVETLASGFTGTHHEIQIMLPVDTDKVFVRWRMTGKHTGEVYGLPASGKDVVLHGHDLVRIEGERIVEIWHIEQLLQLVGQMKPSP